MEKKKEAEGPLHGELVTSVWSEHHAPRARRLATPKWAKKEPSTLKKIDLKKIMTLSEKKKEGVTEKNG